MSHGRESGLRWVNRESNQDRSGCVGCRFKLEPVSVEMGSVHTHTWGEGGWDYLFYIVRFRLSIR